MAGLSDVRDILRGVFASLFGFGGRLIARAILIIAAGRLFGMTELGVLGQVAAVVEIAAFVSVAGLKRSLLDMLSYRAERGLAAGPRVTEAVLVVLALSFGLSALLYFAWPYIVPRAEPMRELLFFAIPAFAFTEVGLTAIKYRRVIKWDVLSRGFTEPWSFLSFTMLAFFTGLISGGLVYAYIGSLLVSAVTVGIGLVHTYGLRELITPPRISQFVPILRQSIPVGITDLGNMMLRRIDILVLGQFVPDAGTGLYYTVQQLATIPQKVQGLFEPMVSPVLAQLHNARDATAGRRRSKNTIINVCRWIFIIQLGLSIPMVIYGDALLSLFGPEFSAGALCLAIILLAELLDGTVLTTETPLVFSVPKIPPWLLVIALVIEVLAIGILSHFYGVNGAAAGFAIAVAALAAGRMIALKRHFGISIWSRAYFAPIVIAIVLTAALILARHVLSNNGFVSASLIIAALALYALSVHIFAMTRSDRIVAKSMRARRRRKRRAG